jgi:hypothetical protein
MMGVSFLDYLPSLESHYKLLDHDQELAVNTCPKGLHKRKQNVVDITQQ